MIRSSTVCLVKASFFLAVGLVASAGSASGAAITGLLNFSGSGQVRVSGTSLDFNANGLGIDGLFNVTSGTDYFSGYAGGLNSAGDLVDLTQAPGPVNIPGFLQLLLGPRAGLSVLLTEIAFGGGAACPPAAAAGSSCTPAPPLAPLGSPLLITRNAGGTTVTMVVRGSGANGADIAHAVLGTFTAQITGVSPETLLAIVQGGGFVDASYSAEFLFSTPEPASVSTGLVGLGMIGFAAWRRRKA